MSERVIYDRLSLSGMATILDEKLANYEVAHYDATLDLNIALANENDQAIAELEKRLEGIATGLLLLRQERAAMTASTEEIPVATAAENESEEEGR